MFKKIAFVSLFATSVVFFCAAVSAQDFPILDQIAQRVIQKYQQSTCEQLWQERAEKGKAPKPQMEQEALQMLKSDPQMRQAFINKIAAPIANKMFECGMIP
jgi:hypothetical protein